MGTAAAIQLLLGLLDRAAAWGAVVAKAQSEGRDITEEEMDGFTTADDAAREALDDAIAEARRGG